MLLIVFFFPVFNNSGLIGRKHSLSEFAKSWHQFCRSSDLLRESCYYFISAPVIVFCHKELHLKRVRKLASHHPNSPSLKRVAGLATGGKHLCNLYRDLGRQLRKGGIVEPTFLTLPITVRKRVLSAVKGSRYCRVRRVVRMMPWPVIAPHEFVSWLKANDLMELLCEDSDSMIDFWQRMQGEFDLSYFADTDPLKLVPLRLHGDEGTWHRGKNVLIINLQGIRHKQDVYRSRLLLTVLPGNRCAYDTKVLPAYLRRCGKRVKKRKMKINKTLHAVTEFLEWSFQHLATGVWPEEPFVGSLLAI